ncbi:MAG: ATP synthase subunit a [Phycisphaerae bacterium]|nr:ATP synthase subunit a [Phycisphaerae bacterium]
MMIGGAMMLASSNPMEHVLPHKLFEIRGVDVTNQMVMQVVATLFVLWLLVSAFRRHGRANPQNLESMVPRGSGHLFEIICNYLREQVARPILQHHTDRFIPYIWSVFFFIFGCNLLGLLPIDAITGVFSGDRWRTHLAGTATGNIVVTGTMAACTLVMMVVNGLRLGGMHYLAHFCPGPLWLAPLLIPVEIIGLVAKIFALTVRLFANMMAGHILLAVLLGFGTAASGLLGVAIAIPAIAGAAAITCLEIFVAALQAFIFTFLTTLFIGQSVVFHHDAHDEEHPAGDHGHAAPAH